MNNNSAVVTIMAVVILILSLGFIIIQARPRSYTPRIVDVYYYDLGTGQTYLAKSNEIPPIPAPSGKLGVRAHVFSCGDCSNPSDHFIGWLEMYTREAKEQLTNPQPPDPNGPPAYDVWERGHLVRAPDVDKWVPANGEEGFKIMEAMQTKCGSGGQPRPCFPNEP
jgi:hypothetical protein